jgi:S-adenosylmethionine decarboxylase
LLEDSRLGKLKLHGFNNLTKTLSFNIYDICYARTAAQQQEYIDYIDEIYNARRLTEILTQVTESIGATVLNIAHQDYEPQGASVTMLIAEEPLPRAPATNVHKESIVGHLDKSHVTVHTYPESHPDQGISTFRADIDVSTCGHISPLNALNHLIHSFESDIVTIDYRVRGFTRDVRGGKHFLDHKIDSIQNFLSPDIRERYHLVDVNIYQEKLFHTKMRLKEFDLEDYLMGATVDELPEQEAERIRERVHHEMLEIFYGRNLDQL